MPYRASKPLLLQSAIPEAILIPPAAPVAESTITRARQYPLAAPAVVSTVSKATQSQLAAPSQCQKYLSLLGAN
jgi:hypothetical protein